MSSDSCSNNTIESSDTIINSDLKNNGMSNSQQISINFDIMNIYRIDTSCVYITRDLGQQISNKYMNKKKKCAFASFTKLDGAGIKQPSMYDLIF